MVNENSKAAAQAAAFFALKVIVINQRTIINDRNRSLNSLKDQESDRPDDGAEYRRIREIIALNCQAGRIEESSDCSGEAVCLTEVRFCREQEALYSKPPWIQQCRKCTAQPIQSMNNNVVKVADQCNTWEEESVDGKVKRVPSSYPQRLPSWEQMLRWKPAPRLGAGSLPISRRDAGSDARQHRISLQHPGSSSHQPQRR